MAGQLQTRGFNSPSDLIFQKSFTMKRIQHNKLLAIVFYFAMLYLPACDSTGKKPQEISASDTSNTKPITNRLLGDNEVKAEAPDAEIKAEQGYAFPRHSDKFAQSPIDIISDKTDKAGKEVLFTFHSDIDTVKNLGHTIERRERDENDAAGLVRSGKALAVDVFRAFLIEPDHLASRALPLLPPPLE